MARSVHQKTFPSSTRHLSRVRRFVQAYAEAAGLSETAVEQCCVAVDEACANVIKHAYHGDEGREIDIAVITEPDRFTVRIRDEGDPFQPAAYTEPDIRKQIKRRRGGGLGVYLMRRFMDDVAYATRGRVNEVRLTKYRNGRREEDGA